MLISREIWGHTILPNNFSDTTGLQPAVHHEAYHTDYTYNLSITRFSILDHFLLSGTSFENSVDSIAVLHDTDRPRVYFIALIA